MGYLVRKESNKMPLEDVIRLVPRLIRAAFMGDLDRVESLGLLISRKINKTYPAIAEEIADSIAQHDVGASPLRSVGIEPPPSDRDSRLSLVKVEEPCEVPPPVLRPPEQRLLGRFVHEWMAGKQLVAQGIKPPTSLLLTGAPGVGKTHTVRHLAASLRLPLLLLDLSTAISSYLGKTGQNLRTVLDYARSQPCVLFLDEFDAIAKKRDDPSDLGELKRMVNVLLKELETWPSHGIIAAATNHPELLDKAIWRRFDQVVEITPPGTEERKQLLERHLGQVLETVERSGDVIPVFAELTEGLSAADVCKFTDRILRRVVLDYADPIRVSFEELPAFLNGNAAKMRGPLCRAAKAALGDAVTIRELATWLDISPSTVHHHLKNRKGEETSADIEG
jgi:MoxR-like ATPase